VTEIVPAAEASELAGLYSARTALEQSRDLSEIKQLHDTALAAKRYAEAKKLGAEMTGYAQEIVNRAERRMGQLLAETPAEPGKRSDLVPDGNEVTTRRQQIGSRKLSARAQLLAELPEADFEKLVTKPVTRVARIARDRRAEWRRRQEAMAANNIAEGETTWERTEYPRTLHGDLRALAEFTHGPDLMRDAFDCGGAFGWYRSDQWDGPGRYFTLEQGAAEAWTAATAEARAELDSAIAAYKAELAAAVGRARAAADRVGAMLLRAAEDTPDKVLYTTYGYHGTVKAAS
jgi:hypothetical protein